MLHISFKSKHEEKCYRIFQNHFTKRRKIRLFSSHIMMLAPSCFIIFMAWIQWLGVVPMHLCGSTNYYQDFEKHFHEQWSIIFNSPISVTFHIISETILCVLKLTQKINLICPETPEVELWTTGVTENPTHWGIELNVVYAHSAKAERERKERTLNCWSRRCALSCVADVMVNHKQHHIMFPGWGYKPDPIISMFLQT